jgi:hypothetical protein
VQAQAAMARVVHAVEPESHHKVGTGVAAPALSYEAPAQTAKPVGHTSVASYALGKACRLGTGGAAPASAYYPSGEAPAEETKPVDDVHIQPGMRSGQLPAPAAVVQAQAAMARVVHAVEPERHHKVGTGGAAPASSYEAPAQTATPVGHTSVTSYALGKACRLGTGGAAPASAYYPSGEAPAEETKPVDDAHMKPVAVVQANASMAGEATVSSLHLCPSSSLSLR